jgi:hypothetical protein
MKHINVEKIDLSSTENYNKMYNHFKEWFKYMLDALDVECIINEFYHTDKFNIVSYTDTLDSKYSDIEEICRNSHIIDSQVRYEIDTEEAMKEINKCFEQVRYKTVKAKLKDFLNEENDEDLKNQVSEILEKYY